MPRKKELNQSEINEKEIARNKVENAAHEGEFYPILAWVMLGVSLFFAIATLLHGIFSPGRYVYIIGGIGILFLGVFFWDISYISISKEELAAWNAFVAEKPNSNAAKHPLGLDAVQFNILNKYKYWLYTLGHHYLIVIVDLMVSMIFITTIVGFIAPTLPRDFNEVEIEGVYIVEEAKGFSALGVEETSTAYRFNEDKSLDKGVYDVDLGEYRWISKGVFEINGPLVTLKIAGYTYFFEIQGDGETLTGSAGTLKKP